MLFNRNAAKQICSLITVYSGTAENVSIGGFTKIRSQASKNFMLS